MTSEDALPPAVVLDANVLIPNALRDTLLRASEAGWYEPSWSRRDLGGGRAEPGAPPRTPLPRRRGPARFSTPWRSRSPPSSAPSAPAKAAELLGGTPRRCVR